MSTLDELLDADLAALEAAGLLRTVASGEDRPGYIDVSSNDYLGQARRVVSRETMSSARMGAGASRLIHGTQAVHRELERELADWVGMEDALLFSSGYAANVGALSALATREDLIVSDALNHASIIDGCRLSRAQVVIVPHGNAQALERALRAPARRRWVVVESYFSMDGDSPDLSRVRDICDSNGAFLLLDEAHALGVFGDQGSGLARRAGVRADVFVGTLGKAVGAQGAFVAGSTSLIRWLWNRARSFVFSTGVSPCLAQVALHAVRRARQDDAGRARLNEHVTWFEQALRAAGVALGQRRHGPIFPIILGAETAALEAQRDLAREGFLAQAIRPPTVPEDTARLRVTVNAPLDRADLTRLATLLGQLAGEPRP